MNSSETLRDLLDIQIKMSATEARKLLVVGKLPNNVFVDGDLDLSGTKITSLPDNLEVDGDLDLYETKITSLPANLRVGGSLYLNQTKITSLPDDIYVGGDVISSVKLKGKKPKGVKGRRSVA